MLVVGPTPYSVPVNSANMPTEAVETQNKVTELIPQSGASNTSSQNTGPQSGLAQTDTERSVKTAELREAIFGSNTSDSKTNTEVEAQSKTSTTEESKQTERSNEASANEARQEKEQARQDQAIIRELSAIDRRVKAHEQAHASVGGVYAGSANFTYQTGPNGVRYAVGGEVPIDTSGVPGNPQATLRKAEQVARAALAPADPSSVDRQIASSAQALATKARFEISRLAAERIQESRAEANGEEVESNEPFKSSTSSTSFSGGRLHASLRTDATEQVGGQVSASA